MPDHEKSKAELISELNQMRQRLRSLEGRLGGRPSGRTELPIDLEQLGVVLEAAPSALIVVGPKGQIEFINPMALEMFGYSEEELLGQSVEMLVPESLREGHVDKRQAFQHKPAPRKMEQSSQLMAVRKDGAVFPVDIGLGPMQLADGVHTACLIVDISSRQRAERELRRLTEFHAGIVEHAFEGIVVQDVQGHVTFANPAACDLLGYQPHELVGVHWTEFVPEDQQPIVQEADARRERGESDQYELSLQSKQGRRIQVLVSGVPRIENGEFAGTLVTFTDVTGLQAAEAQARLQSAALEAAANAMAITDAQGTILWVNDAWTKLTGYELEEAVGENPRILKSGVQGRDFYAQLWDTITAGRVWHGELVNRRKDGRLYTEEETITPLHDDEGRITHYIAVKQDISERKQNEARIRRQLSQINALRTIDLAITASLDPRVTFSILLTQVTEQLGVDAADVLTYDPHSQTLEFSDGKGFITDSLVHTHLRVGEGLAGTAAATRETVSIPDLTLEGGLLDRSPTLREEGFVAYFAVPLIAKGSVQGVIEIFHRSRLDPDQAWFDFLEALAGQAAIAIDNAVLFEQLHQSNSELVQAYDSTLAGWARALELRDLETSGHSKRVTETTLRLARDLGVTGDALVQIRRGALLHDIGKMGVPDSILHKAGPLSQAEWDVMRKHPVYAFEMLSSIRYLQPALEIPYCHHERWDGSGYPRGLKGEEIPLAARVFAVVDVWDALLSDRPYRSAWSEEDTREYMRDQRGRHFDPQVVDAFFDLLADQGVYAG